MKLIDIILLTVSFSLLMIGVYEVIIGSWSKNYWIIMLALMLFGYYGLRKSNNKMKKND